MNTCRYCDAPSKRILCGGTECARRYNAERSKETMRRRRGFYDAPREGSCENCGETFAFPSHGSAGRKRFCSRSCQSAVARRDRRVKKAGWKLTKLRRLGIYERDNWTCHICGDPVNRLAVVPELDAPTLDHVVALAAGGAHHESNLKTAHFYCNSVKRELPLSQVA